MIAERKDELLFLKLNDFEIRFISSYTPVWATEYDDRAVSMGSGAHVGTRFSAVIQTSSMVEEEADELIAELSKSIVNFCSYTRNNKVEYMGKVKINYYGKIPLIETPTTRFFSVSFAVTAITLIDSICMGLAYDDINNIKLKSLKYFTRCKENQNTISNLHNLTEE